MRIKPLAYILSLFSLTVFFPPHFAFPVEAEAYLARENYGALLEPIDGVLTGAGQDPVGYDGYLRARGKSLADSPASPAVAVTLPDAVEKAVNGGFDGGLAPWVLTLHSGADATADLDVSGALGAGNSAKVTVRKGSTNWFVQLAQPVMTRAGRDYTLTLTAKADRPCSVEAFIQQAHEPYASLASKRVSLAKEGRTFTLRIPAPATDDRMNLTVMLGGNAGRTVWIDSVSLVETK